MKGKLIDKHAIQANKGKVFGQLAIEHIFGFCRTFQKVTKNLCFHIILGKNDFHDNVFTTLLQGTIIYVTFVNLHLIVPNFIPSPNTQVFLSESMETSLPYHLILGQPTKKQLRLLNIISI